MTPACTDCVHYMDLGQEQLCSRYTTGEDQRRSYMHAEQARKLLTLCGPDGRQFKQKEAA